MPIPVVCPGCKVRFSVSEKFAGKTGACPKCKTRITIPLAAPEEIKVHEPEQFASAGKDSKGRPVSKPIPRTETRLQTKPVIAIAAAALVTLLLALLGRKMPNAMPLAFVGLAVLSPALAVGGYSFLRDDELEPYRGRSLWVRAVLCGFVYALLWGAYAFLAGNRILNGEIWQWLFVAPIFIGIAAGAAYSTLDLDFGNAALHYCFYLSITLLLRAALGWPPIWAGLTS